MKSCPLTYLIHGQYGKNLACSANGLSFSRQSNNAPPHIKHTQPSDHPEIREIKCRPSVGEEVELKSFEI